MVQLETLAEDLGIWAFAGSEGYTIVTKASDFNDLSALRGAPSKVIWVRIGNCTTTEIEYEAERSISVHGCAG
jgi:predicted nuclease of predicted toxin-antitoxin system